MDVICKWFSSCPLRRFEEEGKLSGKWKREYCETRNNWENCMRYRLTEIGKPHPDNMLPSGKIDKKLS